ncbi:MAG: hypothetical protein M1828_007051 [Chrysothrix sp. TS-e1954]|nr:MAG: hypothetical protein M1828_007051 [Chrysothrix sp. TS-e1954]
MNARLQERFDRVESALDTLVDSITSYNPSVPAAASLLAADDDLTRGLDELSKHQSNYSLLLSLREVSTSLDERIKSTISLLAETRQELLRTSAESDDEDDRPRPLDFKELLEYAQRIAKYSVTNKSAPQGHDDQPNETSVDSVTNGTQKEIQPLSIANGDPKSESMPRQDQDDGEGRKPMPTFAPGEREWLEPDASAPRLPFPADEMVRGGALSRIQAKLDEGLDPSSMDLGRDLKTNAAGDQEEDAGAYQEHDGSVRRQSFVSRSTFSRPTAEEMRAEQERKEAMFQDMNLYNPDEDD